MSLMQAPVGIILIHRAKTREETSRSQYPRWVETPPGVIRATIGRILIAAGCRLAPQHDGPERAIGQLSAAR